MAESPSIDFPALVAAPALEHDEEHPAVTEVQRFLQRYGYLPRGEATPGLIDQATSEALAAYQRFHSLPETGNFDAAVRDLMPLPRCGLQDLHGGIAFQVSKPLDHLDLTFAFGKGTADQNQPGYLEFDLVRRAFGTWASTGHFAFHEVSEHENPDFHISWSEPGDPNYDFASHVLAHADPPGPDTQHMHFNDLYNWSTSNYQLYATDTETIALHEIGHLLGLGHSSVVGSVMQPENDPYLEHRTLDIDTRAGIDALYGGRRPSPLVSAVIFNVRQHFGDEQGDLPGDWVGTAGDYDFDLPAIDVKEPAYLLFQARAVTSENNLFTINDQPIPGGVPVTSGVEGWAGQVMLLSPHALRPGKNVLRVEARDSGSGTSGDLDDFVMDNAVVLYSTIKPGLFLLPPSKWGPNGEPGRLHEGVVQPVGPA